MVNVTYFFRQNPLAPLRLLFPISKQQGIFYIHFPIDRTAHTTSFDGPVVDHGLDQKITQTANTSAMQARSDDSNLHVYLLHQAAPGTPT